MENRDSVSAEWFKKDRRPRGPRRAQRPLGAPIGRLCSVDWKALIRKIDERTMAAYNAEKVGCCAGDSQTGVCTDACVSCGTCKKRPPARAKA